MKFTSTVCITLLALANFAQAQDALGIRESTDPDRVAEVERRAQDLQQKQATTSSGMSATTSSGDTAVPATKKHRVKKHHPAKKAATPATSDTSKSSGESTSGMTN